MKTIIFFASVVPGAAFAHGGHAPLQQGVHEISHAAPALGVGILLIAAGAAAFKRWSS